MRRAGGAIICWMLSLAGLGVCVYLGWIHIALLRGELVGGAACGASGSAFNCHIVTGGPLGSFLGLPLSLWGLIGYLAVFSLSFIAWQLPDQADTALTAVAGLSLLFILIDLGLLAAMIWVIRYFCPLCLSTYAVNLGLLLSAKSASGKRWSELFGRVPAALGAWLPRPGAAAVWIVWGVVLTGALGVVGIHLSTLFVSQGAPGGIRKQIEQSLHQQKPVSVDTAGDPMEGASTPTVRIVEFSDFLCPSCYRAAQFNPIVLAAHRQDVSMTFKNFPLDMTCNDAVKRVVHPNSCQIAAASECAQEQGKFWALHDTIFAKGTQYLVGNLERYAMAAGVNVEKFRECIQSGRGLDAVKRDIAEATRLGITSTPTYIVNGYPVAGGLVPSVLEELIQAAKESGS